MGVQSFSERLDYLFRTVRPRNREYTYEEIAARVRERGGEEISGTYISMLRRGLRDNPTRRHIEGLAAAFGVPPNFFFDQTAAEEIAAKLELLASMRDAGVQRVALRASELSPEGLTSDPEHGGACPTHRRSSGRGRLAAATGGTMGGAG